MAVRQLRYGQISLADSDFRLISLADQSTDKTDTADKNNIINNINIIVQIYLFIKSIFLNSNCRALATEFFS